ncbi:MAG: hypothetical protein LH473_00030 [Chitinophagales bacterium]|nr:hypothetical protein [Chitinophagales bacterium]
MKKQTLIAVLFLCALTTFSSCAVVGGIFKTGMGVGILMVVIVLAIIIFIITKTGGGGKT